MCTTLLSVLFCTMWVSSEAQCPIVRMDLMQWAADISAPGSEEGQAILDGVRETVDRYCRVADLTDITDHRRGYNEEKDLMFQSLFRDGGLIFNDLIPDWGQRVSPDEYRSMVRGKLFNSGVDFLLGDAVLEEIWVSGGYFRARLKMNKTMYNGLNKRFEEIRYKRGKEPVIPLIVEIRLLALQEGRYDGVITSIAHARPKAIKPTAGRFFESDLAGLYGFPLQSEPAFAWKETKLPSFRHVMVQLGTTYAHPLFSSEKWYGLVGLHVRQGWLGHSLSGDLILSAQEDQRLINGRTYDVPFDQHWSFMGGSFRHAYLSIQVPIGVRFIPNPNLFESWMVDLQILPGWTWHSQEYKGDLVLEHGYDGYLDCRVEIEEGSEDLSDRWGQPALSFRLSPGYYRQVPSMTSNIRSIGWFLRMDVEAGLFPLFSREDEGAWLSLDAAGRVVRTPGAGMLYRKYMPVNAGLRAGIYWKFF